MLPLPLPPEVVFVAESIKPTDEMYKDFNFSYEKILSIIEQLEQVSETASQFNEEEANKLRIIVSRLAHLGASHAAREEAELFNRDIDELFASDEDDSLDFEIFGYNDFDGSIVPYFDEEGRIIPCKSVWKRIGRIAHKIEKFVRGHKKEVLIGAIAAVGVGVAAYAIIGTYAGASAAAASGAAVGAAADGDRKGEKKSSSAQEVTEQEASTTADLVSPSTQERKNLSSPKEEAASLRQELQKTVPSDCFWNPFSNKSVKDVTREIASTLAHEAWSVVREAVSIGEEANREIEDIGKLINSLPLLGDQHSSSNSEEIKQHWRECIVAGHKKIDEWFSTKFADSYIHEEFDPPSHLFQTVEVGLPIGPGLWRQIKEVANLAKAARLGRESAAAAKELSLANRQIQQIKSPNARELRSNAQAQKILTREKPLIRPQANGIWEIDGKNIKRFDLQQMLDNNRIKHIFHNPEHNLDKLGLSHEAVYENLTKEIVKADKLGKIPINQPFKICVHINEYEVEVRGIVIDNELRYSTFFIPNK